MDNELLRLEICDLQKEKQGIDLFSKEYLFDVKHAEDRSKVFFYGGSTMHRSRLSVLLREAMTKEQRERLFPGNYDLGSMRYLKPELCKLDSIRAKNSSLLEELTQELWQEKKLDNNGPIDRSGLKKIKASIAELTGRKMEQHYARNKSTALKVVKLLYRLSKDRWSGSGNPDKPKRPQLLAILRWPEGKKDYSLSFRDAYPYKENTDQVWLIADLKTYLSVELDEKTHEKIGALNFFLHECLKKTEHNVEKVLSRMSYQDQVMTYKHLAIEVNLLTVDPQLADIPLDEELYFYLNALEFAHFAEGYPDLLEKAKSDCSVLPVFPDIDRLAKDVTQSECVGMHDPVFSPDEFPDFIQDCTELLCLIVGKAGGKEIAPSELKKSTKYALNLLCTHAMFRKQWQNGDMKAPLFSTLECVAAICCVLDEETKKESERTKHMPYWKGQAAQGDSILTALKTTPVVQNIFKDPVPEEHRHIWANRLEWFIAALQDHVELKTQQFAFRLALVGKMKEISKTNNLASVYGNLRKLGLKLGRLISSSV